MNRQRFASYLRALALAASPTIVMGCDQGGYCEPDGSVAMVMPDETCRPAPTASGPVAVVCTRPRHCFGGRRTEGLAAVEVNGPTSIARWFSHMAHLEAASVPAFARLVDELIAHGAPEGLVAAARGAIADEARHARVLGAIARRYGGTVPAALVSTRPPRSLVELVRENAVEGCVGETWGAVIAFHQSAHAADRRVRNALADVAEDEARHAELAWAIAAWAEPRLPRGERAVAVDARREAVRELADDTVASGDDTTLIGEGGLPSRDHALALIGALRSSLWS